MKTILVKLGQLVGQVVVFLLFFMLLGSLAVAARNSVLAVTELSWIAGVIVGVIWLIGVFLVCVAVWYAMRPSAPKWLQNYILIRKKVGEDAGLAEQYPAASLSALLCVAILIAVFALTAVSETLASQGVLTYTVEGALEQPMAERLFRLYMWHTIDMIPFIDIWDTYGIKPPLQPQNFWAQSTVLVFRTAVVGFAASVIAQWVNYYRDEPQHGGQPSPSGTEGPACAA